MIQGYLCTTCNCAWSVSQGEECWNCKSTSIHEAVLLMSSPQYNYVMLRGRTKRTIFNEEGEEDESIYLW